MLHTCSRKHCSSHPHGQASANRAVSAPCSSGNTGFPGSLPPGTLGFHCTEIRLISGHEGPELSRRRAKWTSGSCNELLSGLQLDLEVSGKAVSMCREKPVQATKPVHGPWSHPLDMHCSLSLAP